MVTSSPASELVCCPVARMVTRILTQCGLLNQFGTTNNIEGRSATDSADQARRKLALAERRIERAGHKGIAFVLDVALTNGHVMKRWLQPEGNMVKLHQQHTKVKFCMRWGNQVLSQATSYRRRLSKNLRAARLAQAPSACSLLTYRTPSGGSSSTAGLAEHHILVDLYKATALEAAAQKAKRSRGRPKKVEHPPSFGRGYCGVYNSQGVFAKCGLPDHSDRTSLFCQTCRQYYHLPCFMQQHFCRYMK
mmetsp:Transcript_7682/g.11647  ORF Transcript_7682/g.11647 Transcript_7682/m.11647 type:complete len:249 (+) Transcript_7682:451-1197(+)